MSIQMSCTVGQRPVSSRVTATLQFNLRFALKSISILIWLIISKACAQWPAPVKPKVTALKARDGGSKEKPCTAPTCTPYPVPRCPLSDRHPSRK